MIAGRLGGKTFGAGREDRGLGRDHCRPGAGGAEQGEHAERNRVWPKWDVRRRACPAMSCRFYRDVGCARHCARAQVYKESGAFPGVLMDQFRAMAYLDLMNEISAEARIAQGPPNAGLGAPGEAAFRDEPEPDDPGAPAPEASGGSDCPCNECGRRLLPAADDDALDDDDPGGGPDDDGPDGDDPDDDGPDDRGIPTMRARLTADRMMASAIAAPQYLDDDDPGAGLDDDRPGDDPAPTPPSPTPARLSAAAATGTPAAATTAAVEVTVVDVTVIPCPAQAHRPDDPAGPPLRPASAARGEPRLRPSTPAPQARRLAALAAASPQHHRLRHRHRRERLRDRPRLPPGRPPQSTPPRSAGSAAHRAPRPPQPHHHRRPADEAPPASRAAPPARPRAPIRLGTCRCLSPDPPGPPRDPPGPPGPPGGPPWCRTWIITLPSGPQYQVPLEPVPTHACDHQPGPTPTSPTRYPPPGPDPRRRVPRRPAPATRESPTSSTPSPTTRAGGPAAATPEPAAAPATRSNSHSAGKSPSLAGWHRQNPIRGPTPKNPSDTPPDRLRRPTRSTAATLTALPLSRSRPRAPAGSRHLNHRLSTLTENGESDRHGRRSQVANRCSATSPAAAACRSKSGSS